MSSYPASNKTSLSRKPCIADKKKLDHYQLALSESVKKKSREAPPGEGLTIASYLVGNTTSLSWKPCMVAKQLLWITIRKSWSLFQNPS